MGQASLALDLPLSSDEKAALVRLRNWGRAGGGGLRFDELAYQLYWSLERLRPHFLALRDKGLIYDGECGRWYVREKAYQRYLNRGLLQPPRASQ